MNASLEKAIQEAMVELDRMSEADWKTPRTSKIRFDDAHEYDESIIKNDIRKWKQES